MSATSSLRDLAWLALPGLAVASLIWKGPCLVSSLASCSKRLDNFVRSPQIGYWRTGGQGEPDYLVRGGTENVLRSLTLLIIMSQGPGPRASPLLSVPGQAGPVELLVLYLLGPVEDPRQPRALDGAASR